MAAREPGWLMYESVWRSSEVLSPRARGAFLCACAAFYFDGVEPQTLSKDAALLFAGTRHRIERARSVAQTKRNEQHSEPLPDGNGCPTGPLPDEYGRCSEPVPASENRYPPANTFSAPTDVVPRVGDSPQPQPKPQRIEGGNNLQVDTGRPTHCPKCGGMNVKRWGSGWMCLDFECNHKW